LSKQQLVNFVDYMSFFIQNAQTYLLLRTSALLYSSQAQYKRNNQCFQTHQEIWSLLYLNSVVLVCVEVGCQK